MVHQAQTQDLPVTRSIGGCTFYHYNVAFHFERDNSYSPWLSVGVYITCPRNQHCRYLIGYEYIQKQFRKELDLIDSEYIKGGPEFLNWWRDKYQDLHSVISPIINFYSRIREFDRFVLKLFTRYVGNISSHTYVNLAVMLKMKESYYPALFQSNERKLHHLLVEASSL